MYCAISDKKLTIYTREEKKKLYAVLDFDYLTCYVLLNKNMETDLTFTIKILGIAKEFKLKAHDKESFD